MNPGAPSHRNAPQGAKVVTQNLGVPNPDSEQYPCIGPGFRLQWEPAQNSHVLLYPEGMVKLNQSAGEILKRCDGSHSLSALIAALEQAFQAQGLASEVTDFLRQAQQQRWIVWRPAPTTPPVP